MHLGFLTIYWRDMIRFVRFRTLLISSLVQPALWMAFFGIAMSANFNRLTSEVPPVPGIPDVGYLTFMAAGVIAMTTLFTSLFGGMVLLFDKNWGLLREVMASPLPRDHVIFGIALSGMTKSFIQAIIIMVFGILLGAEFFRGYGAAEVTISLLGILLFVGIFSLGFLFLSAAIAISLESPEGMQGIMTLLTMPIFFASNALYPVNAFPPVLQAVSVGNPLTHLVNGIRYFAIGDHYQAIGIVYTTTPADMLISFFVLVVFALVMFGLAWWRFQKAVVT
ncbi:MAG TPA: ABC transporter permease [Methanolinea sp.]|jgi:ABC-2 type transport system permease protein|nr:MAG: ABC-2 type transporter [Methanoregulaceae archaeon PtaB.Bin009]OPY42042.1 MAG: ABC-2 type transporter [Methanoregulaceae archaeon PtaU1.Bin066]HII75560.1 ABC transporter permease [Methanolinea sp.]HNQ29599.1 ABC transporter permease [Methanolinea sp.]